MVRTILLAGLMFVGLESASACNSDDTNPTTTTNPTVPSSESGAVTVKLQGDRFVSADITIQSGQTVTWLNTDDELHTVTSGTDASDPGAGADFDHQLPSSGATFSQKFIGAGTFPYFCRIHGAMGMKGTVTVTAP